MKKFSKHQSCHPEEHSDEGSQLEILPLHFVQGQNDVLGKPSKNTLSFYFLSIVCSLMSIVYFSGCGYTTKSTLPASIKTIRVEPFKNSINYTEGTGRNIYFPLLEVKARNAVIDRFLFDGNLKVVEPHEADLILEGELKRYQRSGLRFTDDDDVQEYRVHVTVSFELRDTQSGEVSWSEPNFVGEATYFVTGAEARSEESAVDDAIVDLARRIVERTIEDW
ncbi:MAG: LptE family protein [Candidatus Omnitrophica bacterium]|nr:LptE family protein [Candidatus Omnitrophota bacterium]